MKATTRAALRTALTSRYPWLSDRRCGPGAVEAGECDRCGAEARLIATCGPGHEQYLGRRCLFASGEDAFCDGHGAQARAAVGWVRTLPEEADVVARLWWVATGEVRLPADEVNIAAVQLGLPAAVATVAG